MVSDDTTSYCVEGCGRPATHENWIGFTDDMLAVELVCQEHWAGLRIVWQGEIVGESPNHA